MTHDADAGRCLCRSCSLSNMAALDERAKIVDWLRMGNIFGVKQTPSTGEILDYLADAIEQGRHE